MTQKEKCLALLIRNSDWMATYEFQGQGDLFVGHRGPARISELAIDYPELIETDKTEKVYRYRFRFDNTLKGLQSIPIDLQKFCRAELSNAGRHWQTMSDRVDFEERNGVRTAVIREVVLTV